MGSPGVHGAWESGKPHAPSPKSRSILQSSLKVFNYPAACL